MVTVFPAVSLKRPVLDEPRLLFGAQVYKQQPPFSRENMLRYLSADKKNVRLERHLMSKRGSQVKNFLKEPTKCQCQYVSSGSKVTTVER